MKRVLGLKDQEGDSPLVPFACPERSFHSSSKSQPGTIEDILAVLGHPGRLPMVPYTKAHRSALTTQA